MEIGLSRQEKERIKVLGELFFAECRSSAYNLAAIKNILREGLDVTYKNAQGLYYAVKGLKFDLVDFLVDNGVLRAAAAKNYIASMCEHNGFTDKCEPDYFSIMDKVCAAEGRNVSLFSAYINNAAVNRRPDKLTALKTRYGFSDSDIAKCVYVRIIFEIIHNGFDDVLDYINAHTSWADGAAFDLAVATNEWIALEYLVLNTSLRTPSETAVGQALFEGSVEALTILSKTGYIFKNKPLLLEKACRAAMLNRTEGIAFLFKHGCTFHDKYKGKTVYENAVSDNNAALLEYIRVMQL